MNPSDAAVLCALILQRADRFSDAIELMMRYVRVEPMLIMHPSVYWWAMTYEKQIADWVRSGRYEKWRAKT